MNLYRNKENKLLYVLEHLVYDIKHHNHLDSYTYEKCDIKDEIYDPEKYVENNFEIVCEI